MERSRVNNGRISKNKRCSPCMSCLKKRIEMCKITTPVDKSEVIMNDNTTHDVCKHDQSKANNDT